MHISVPSICTTLSATGATENASDIAILENARPYS